MRGSLPALRTLAIAAAVALLTACASAKFTPLPSGPTQPESAARHASSTTPVQHVVIVIQENRSFNNFFATFPGADGTTTGKTSYGTVPVAKTNLVIPHDLGHSYQVYQISRDGGKMDGFNLVKFANGKPQGKYPYRYVDPAQIKPYWTMAKQYVLAEHMFTTEGSGSFTAHQDLIAGGTVVSPGKALVNFPTGAHNTWGCDATKGTVTSLITQNDKYEGGKGPFPCLSYETMRDVLDAGSVSWKYYAPPLCCNVFGRLLTAYDAIKAVRYGPEWTTNVISPQTKIFDDISAGTLPGVSWLVPDEKDSDHPGTSSDTGPAWVTSVVNAIGESSSWDSTAIVVIWDDWGGLYDNAAPPQLGYGGLGFRVPALVISPYAKRGYISTTQYEFGSILKFIEQNWSLGSLGSSDQRANSLADCFNFKMKPRKFVPISAKYSKSYFLHERPSYVPDDTDF